MHKPDRAIGQGSIIHSLVRLKRVKDSRKGQPQQPEEKERCRDQEQKWPVLCPVCRTPGPDGREARKTIEVVLCQALVALCKVVRKSHAGSAVGTAYRSGASWQLEGNMHGVGRRFTRSLCCWMAFFWPSRAWVWQNSRSRIHSAWLLIVACSTLVSSWVRSRFVMPRGAG